MIHNRAVLLFDIVAEHSLWLVSLCVLLGFLYALILYYKNEKNKELSPSISTFLFVARTILISFLSFFLLNPLIKNTSLEYEKPLILIAQDNSASIAFSKDSAFIKKQFLPQLIQFGEALKEKYDVKTYQFDHELKQSDHFSLNGKESDYSVILKEIENNYENRNLGAVVISGDGLYNKGNNPVYLSTKIKCPVYTIALGDTSLVKDVLIKKIDHNQVAYLGNKFPVEVTIEQKRITKYTGILTVSKDGKKIAEQALSSNTLNSISTFNFAFDADKPGIQKYTVNVSYADGEANKINNSRSFVIDVIDNREKILILYSAPHPDIAAIKESIESSKNYEVVASRLADFNDPLKPFSLVILHQLQVSPDLANGRLIKELNAQSISYFVITNAENDKLPGINISGNGNRQTDAEAVLNKGFSLFTLSEEFKNFVRYLPPLKIPLGNYSISNSSNVLLNQRIGVVETDNPILTFNQNNEQKIGILLGDGLWKWKLRDFAEHENHNLFNELMSKIVQYLSVKADKSFFRVFTKKLINENENIEFNAEVYNNTYELITEPEVSLVLINEAGKKFDYTFSKKDKSYRLNAGIFPPGNYSYNAQVKSGEQIFTQKGIITIKELVAEQVNTMADHQVMYQMAKRTGGEMFYPNDLKKLQNLLENKNDLKTIAYTHKKLSDLIEIKWIFWLILLLLSMEWFIRKRNGLY